MSFTIAGKRTNAWYWGKGPVVVLVHGWSSKGFHFRKFIDPLVQKGFTVVIPDLPGHVKSEGKTTNVLEFKATVEAIVNHFDTVYALVGHSLGAMASVLFLTENTHKVDRLVVANSAAYAESIMNRFMEQINGSNQVKQALLKRLWAKFDQDFNYYSIYNRIQEVKELPKILVIGDHDDPEVSIEEVKAFAQVTNSKLMETEGLGHNNGLKSDDVVEEVVEFMA
ncbi:MAG: alpha/beta hydrolase [Bacteroidetes bacterium]|nr:alpha/beta hydrolase [Bacteroidota bacterium]